MAKEKPKNGRRSIKATRARPPGPQHKPTGKKDPGGFKAKGFKSEGLINRSEFNNKDLPEIGSKIDIFLEKFEDADGNITLSKYKADFIKRWDELRELCDNAKPVKGKIIKRVKGGLIVDLDVIQAFLPGSQVDVQPVKNFDDFLNKNLFCHLSILLPLRIFLQS